MTKSLITRAISAILAVLLLVSLYYFLGLEGLKLVVYFSVAVGAYELANILLPKSISKLHKFLFFLTAILNFHTATHYPSVAMIAISIFIVIFFTLGILTHKYFLNLDDLLSYQTRSVAGFIYISLLPSYAYRILELSHGLIWFGVLLASVFAGDIGAYIMGTLAGRNKILPRLSPNKTWEGAFGGLLGSVAAGYAYSNLLPHVPLFGLLAIALFAGVVAQAGDFFESLIKRTAGVKDSGWIMPGHGGALDRIDGVLFASPVVMIAASLFEAL